MKSHEIWGHIGGHFWVLGLIYDKVGRSLIIKIFPNSRLFLCTGLQLFISSPNPKSRHNETCFSLLS